MIPMRTSTIFKNRWMALVWAAGIIWFALDVAGPDESQSNNTEANQAVVTDVTGEPIDEKQVQEFADALNGM